MFGKIFKKEEKSMLDYKNKPYKKKEDKEEHYEEEYN